MIENLPAILIAVGLMIGMLLFMELGRWVGKRGILSDPENSDKGIGTVDSAIFALFGLLIAFSFSGAAERFNNRRDLIVQEANDIGTAWSRVDLLPVESRASVKELFRKYLDSRLETYRKVPDMVAVYAEIDRSTKLQQEIWRQSVAACDAKKDPATTNLLLSSLNTMIDITTTRTMATRMHPPTIIFSLLFCLAIVCAFLAGHGMSSRKNRCWFHTFGFSIVITLTIFVILDIEYPRVGFIRVDEFDKVLQQLRDSMN